MFYIIIYILLFLGIFFNLLGALGILRFPDVYTRLHAGTKCTTFGSIYLIGSVILLGLKHGVLSGQRAVLNSRVAIRRFMNHMQKEPFMLHVKGAFNDGE